jgi:superfamily II DNA or RNA helicase
MISTLYEHFELLDPEQLPKFGNDRERRAGHQLYEKQTLNGLEWLKPEQHLRCQCDKRRVEFANKDGKLLGVCACGGTLEKGACRHLFSILFTVVNILDDNRFRVLFRNNKFHEHLKQVYWSAQGQVRNDSIPLDGHPELRLYVDDLGNFRIRLPTECYEELREQERPEKDPLYRLTHLHHRDADGQRALIKYLESTPGPVPLSAHLPTRVYNRLRWDCSKTVSVANVMKITSDSHVSAHHEFMWTESPADSSTPVIPLPPLLVLDPETWTLGPMKDYLDLDDMIHAESPGMTLAVREDLSVEAFNSGQIAVMGAQRDQAMAGLSLRNATGDPGSKTLSARVCANLVRENSRYAYCPAVLLDGDAGTEVRSTMNNFLRHFISPPRKLASSARRRELWQLFDAFFLEENETSARETQEVILRNGSIPEDLHEKVIGLLDDFQRDVLNTRRYVLRVEDDVWRDFEIPYRDLGFALAVGRRVLQGAVEEDRDALSLSVSAGRLEGHLSTLVDALKTRDIEVRLDYRPVRRARLDIQLAPRPAGALDWFELHPLVRFEGREISREEWMRILTGGGVAAETDNSLAVVAPSDLEILQRLRDMIQEPQSNSDSQDTCRVHRLRILEWLELEKKGVHLDLEPDLRAVLDRLYAFEKLDPIDPPAELQTQLREYQHLGYEWLSFLYRHHFGACLADDMGLGKTIQTIALLAGIREGMVPPQSRAIGEQPHLIVAPSTLVFNWQEELERFYPALQIREYVGAGRTIAFEDCDVVITTYGILARDIEFLQDISFHVVVYDEAQALKNIQAARTLAARKIKAAFTLCLTGTPLENHIGEFYSLIDLALPGLLGPYRPFMKDQSDERLTTTRQRSAPFVLRRTKEEILAELPPKVDQVIKLDLSEFQRACYTRTVDEVRGTVDEAYKEKTGAQAGVVALTALLRLRQICISPALTGVEDAGISPKIEFLLQRLDELREEGHAALVFSQFTRCLDLVEQAMDEQGIERLRLDGKTPTAKRKGLVNQFQSGEGPTVFLLSLKSGGTGLNLTRASYVFHMDPWWNPAVERQATDRAHRLGQTQTVFSTRLVMRLTVEEKMEVLKRGKEELFQAVLAGSGQRSKSGAITREDFAYLIGDDGSA